MAHRRLETSHL